MLLVLLNVGMSPLEDADEEMDEEEEEELNDLLLPHRRVLVLLQQVKLWLNENKNDNTSLLWMGIQCEIAVLFRHLVISHKYLQDEWWDFVCERVPIWMENDHPNSETKIVLLSRTLDLFIAIEEEWSRQYATDDGEKISIATVVLEKALSLLFDFATGKKDPPYLSTFYFSKKKSSFYTDSSGNIH